MAKTDNSEWVSLRRAAEILGVHPATVRNWAESGKLPFRRTAGKHRRFNVRDLRQHAPAQAEIQPAELQVIIHSALGQTRMQSGSPQMEQADWYINMSDASKQRLREQGRGVLHAIRDFVMAGAPEADLGIADDLGSDYAARLIEDGLSLPQAMGGFFYFSDFVLDSILTWSEIAQPSNSTEWSILLRQVNSFMNAMLLSIVETYAAD